MLYWRTPLTARWQGVNVSAAAAADGPRILPLFEGWEDAFEDITALVRPCSGHRKMRGLKLQLPLRCRASLQD